MLDFIQVKFIAIATNTIELPEYKGSIFRGALGWQFKKLTCILKSRKSCNNCPVIQSCFYFNIFETLLTDKPLLKSGASIPHPYILVPPLEEKRKYNDGETFEFELTIFGKYIEALPYFVFTFNELGKKGFAKKKGTFEIIDIEQNGKSILKDNHLNYEKETFTFTKTSSINSLTISTITPIRLLRKNKPIVNPSFYELFMAALRRAELLLYYYADKKLDDLLNVKELINTAKNIKTVNSDFKWYNWERYSNRQKKRISLSGIIGKLLCEGDISPYYNILKFGELFHIGKNTVFGLGKYQILRKNLTFVET